MAEEKHPCIDGLTEKCFKAYPSWAKRAFAIKLMNTLVPAQISRRLPKGLFPGLIGPGVILPPGVDFPPGTTIPPGYTFPPGWAAGDPVPPGITIPPGITFPPGWTTGDPIPAGVTLEPGATFPPGWTPGDPLPPVFGPEPPPGINIPHGGIIPPTFLAPFEPGPPHRVSPTAPGVTIEGTFTAQNDGRQGRFDPLWATAHGATDGNMIFPAETETDEAAGVKMDPPDWYIWRSFFDFDMSAIPVSATITACTLTLQSYGAETCDIELQEGTQSDSLAWADYDAFTGSPFVTQAWVIGSNILTLSAAGLTYIQSKFGNTAKLCMREYDHDYLNVAPSVGENFQAGLYWSGAAVAANRPKLTVTYET